MRAPPVRRFALSSGRRSQRSSMPDRSTELAAINSYINAHGACRCPERFAARVTAALPPQIEAARIAAIAIKPALTRVENREQLRRLMWGLRARNSGI